MDKYILSKSSEVIFFENQWYVRFNNRNFKINESISAILNKFDTAKTIKNAIKDSIDNINEIELSQVSNDLIPFFKELLKIGVLRKETKSDLVIPDQILQINQEFDNFRVDEKILENRMFVQLYKVFDKKKKRTTVLKFFPHQIDKVNCHSKIEKNYKMFCQELNIFKKFRNHQNVYRYYSSGMYNDYLYIEMEYISGMTLSKISRKQKLPINLKKNYAHQIISAIAHLHKNNIVHSDIHSGNIMITDEKCVKLIDFGYAHDLNYKFENQIINRGGVVHYMPPERVMLHSFKFSDKESNKKAEVYQTAILIYTLFFGKNPFKEYDKIQTWEEMAQRIINEKFNFRIIKNSKMDKILKKALQNNPEDRYISCEEMLSDWEKIIRKHPIKPN